MAYSVVIPTFNRAGVLLRAVSSVAGQTVPPEKLIIIDDHSTDDTGELVKNWIEDVKPAFQVVYQKSTGRGVSGARNSGASLVKTDWLTFLDSDDEWLPEKIERQTSIDLEYSIIHTQENWIRGGTKVNQPKKYLKSGGRIFKRCVDLCFVSPSTVMMKTELFREMNGFREDFPVCEDYELWLRIAAKYEVGFVDQPLINKYGGHADQLSMKFKAMDYYRAKALAAIVASPDLSEEERRHAADTLVRKCEILLAGYQKHSNMGNAAEVHGWLEGLRN